MTMTDPIADMLTRLRNALGAKHDTVTMPLSKIKAETARVLKEEGYINDYSVAKEGPQGTLTMTLKYDRDGASIIQELKRVSTPGLRVYTKAKDIQLFRGGMGTQVVSTSQGVMTSREAIRRNIGGEVLARVW